MHTVLSNDTNALRPNSAYVDPGEDDGASSDSVVGVAVPSESVGKAAAAAFGGPDFLMPISSHLPPSRGAVSDRGTAGRGRKGGGRTGKIFGGSR